jgi:hypothetical protein
MGIGYSDVPFGCLKQEIEKRKKKKKKLVLQQYVYVGLIFVVNSKLTLHIF